MKKALIGFGGHAREVMAQMSEVLPCFVDDEYVTSETFPLSSLDINEYEVLIAVGNSNDRKNIASKLPKDTKFFNFIHPSAIIQPTVLLGQGCFIGAYSIITCNINFGDHILLNRANHVGHDTNIGDYLSMMPGSIISGNCQIGNNVYIGTNASIREKIKICDDVTIGLNAAVVKNINEPGTYVGAPAKKIK
jgi:sugar O-acyltransferase (sialic acid O-acetyltransferase NeuD family)